LEVTGGGSIRVGSDDLELTPNLGFNVKSNISKTFHLSAKDTVEH